MLDVYDAIVIGGGPAGTLAALLLAKQGWSVALLERGPRNRGKACGHCLSPRVWGLIERHELLEGVMRLSFGRTRRLRVHVGRAEALDVPLAGAGERGAGWLVDRRVFDQFLIDRAAAAGAVVIQSAPARLVRLERNAGVVVARGADGPLEIRARMVVGADGLRSAVARAGGLAGGARVGRKYGFSFEMDSLAGGGVAPGAVEMFVGPTGYLGVVGNSAGGVHAAGLVGRGAGETPDPFVFTRLLAEGNPGLRRIIGSDVSRSAVSGFVAAGPMAWRPQRVANGRVALVGDAAGYREPFTGEGMAWALESAAALAEITADLAPGGWNERAARQYERMWRERIGRRQTVCGLAAFALERRGVLSIARRVAGMWDALPEMAARRVLAG